MSRWPSNRMPYSDFPGPRSTTAPSRPLQSPGALSFARTRLPSPNFHLPFCCSRFMSPPMHSRLFTSRTSSPGFGGATPRHDGRTGGYTNAKDGIMAQLTRILVDLKKQRDHARAEAARLNRAIEALSEVSGRRPGAGGGMRGRHMSKAARKSIADAQRARWAKFHAKRSKRNLSPEGRRRISESARARWAASRKAHGDSLGPVHLLSKKAIAAMQENAANAPATRAAKATGE